MSSGYSNSSPYVVLQSQQPGVRDPTQQGQHYGPQPGVRDPTQQGQHYGPQPGVRDPTQQGQHYGPQPNPLMEIMGVDPNDPSGWARQLFSGAANLANYARNDPNFGAYGSLSNAVGMLRNKRG